MEKPASTFDVSAGHDRDVSSPHDLAGIRRAIREKYAEIAVSAEGKFSYPTGKTGAETLGYDSEAIQQAPASLLDSFCGVGNPFSLGEIQAGFRVLDYGCGAGFDLYIASRMIGRSGQVCGVDLTKEMTEHARENLGKADVANYEVRQIETEEMPYPDNYFDVVISNGVINLSPFKLACFREIYRVLKPGGRLQFADVVREKDMPAEMNNSLESWSH